MELGDLATIRDALTQSELEAALLAGTADLTVSCLTHVPHTLAVFVKHPTTEATCVRRIACSSTRHAMSKCKWYAARALRAALDEKKPNPDEIVRTLSVAVDPVRAATQVQIIRPPANMLERHALRAFTESSDHGMTSAFALLLPDIAWARQFPDVAGGLFAVYAAAYPVRGQTARILHALCCFEHIQTYARRGERDLREADARLRVTRERESSGWPPGGIHIPGADIDPEEVGWTAAPVARDAIRGENWYAYCNQFDDVAGIEPDDVTEDSE